MVTNLQVYIPDRNHVPSAILHVHLPPSYPSSCPPVADLVRKFCLLHIVFVLLYIDTMIKYSPIYKEDTFLLDQALCAGANDACLITDQPEKLRFLDIAGGRKGEKPSEADGRLIWWTCVPCPALPGEAWSLSDSWQLCFFNLLIAQ
eukprot:scaffold203884_cov17-Tisochrysis_lutea.AAC.1